MITGIFTDLILKLNYLIDKIWNLKTWWEARSSQDFFLLISLGRFVVCFSGCYNTVSLPGPSLFHSQPGRRSPRILVWLGVGTGSPRRKTYPDQGWQQSLANRIWQGKQNAWDLAQHGMLLDLRKAWRRSSSLWKGHPCWKVLPIIYGTCSPYRNSKGVGGERCWSKYTWWRRHHPPPFRRPDRKNRKSKSAGREGRLPLCTW